MMHDRRVSAIEARALRPLVDELHHQLSIFAAGTTREEYREPFDEILSLFSDEEIDMFDAAMAAHRGGPLDTLTVPTMRRFIAAFKKFNDDHRRGA